MNQPASDRVPYRSPKLQIEYEPVASDIYEVKLIGELGTGSVSSLDNVIRNIFDQGVSRLVINMEGTHYIASAAISVLLASTQIAKESGGGVIFAAVPPRVKHIFDLLGVGNMLNFAVSTKDAAKAFRKGLVQK